MALTATWDPTNARVQLQATGLSASATSTWLEYRVTGTTQWTVVRGAGQVTVTSSATPVLFQHDPPVGSSGVATIEYRHNPNVGSQETTTVGISVADQAWLKWLGYPFLNRRLTVTGYSEITRSGRGQINQVINSRLGVSVGEFMGAREFEFTVRTDTWDQWRELDAALSVGGVVYLLADERALGLPVVNAVVRSITTPPGPRHYIERRYTTIGITEVTAPGWGYAGSVGTWQTVVNQYATWAAVQAAQPTWADLATLAGSTGDVVVG
ncbi:hypothetical protein [Pseudonocardia sp. WMMC193]|uniref:hypothetical protein n=1 Tax=Pseudonocardia sp. WMMC193 TaxID=2911965 RepID=UPI001F455477|nr:hypothetical protein [Pseudonocardia sp. WMMC193]MCF7548896.1 hypothetical protein [Pseudonocardia sp. WMMC193]